MPAPYSLEAHVIAAEGKQLSTNLSGEVVILGVERGIYYGLSDVGAYVWDLLATSRRIEDIVIGVVDTFDVSRDVAERDVLALIASLAEHDLITVDDATDL